ncbi:MAG: hypothetical protein Q4E57_08810 [Eubacteriales bacterium]|nr:hypothetical protein [Eubacteriales bacterium]
MAAAVSAFAASPAFAAASVSSSLPYDIKFSVEECGRICYAGHPSSTVVYKDGLAVTPDTTFRLQYKDQQSGPSEPVAEDISVTISVVYENEDRSGSHKETIKKFDSGDLNFSDDFRLFSDNNVASLEERGRLFSDSLSGVEMTISGNSGSSGKKSLYLYVCDDADFDEYLSNNAGAYYDEQ